MLRSQIIAAAQREILQASQDQLWAFLDWDAFFNESVDILHDALVEADADYFVVRGLQISKVGSEYPLPADFHALLYCEDDEGELKILTQHEEKSLEAVGIRLVNNSLVVVNCEAGTEPASLTIDYIKTPKEIPVWDGTDDATKGDDATYTPDVPLDTNRAARTIARMIAVFARVRDESNTSEAVEIARAMADKFVDRFLTRSQAF